MRHSGLSICLSTGEARGGIFAGHVAMGGGWWGVLPAPKFLSSSCQRLIFKRCELLPVLHLWSSACCCGSNPSKICGGLRLL